jgi:hypothetical protein
MVKPSARACPNKALEGVQRRSSMWLEEMAWLWLPIAGGMGMWMIWSIVTLKRDVRALRQRLALIEAPSITYANQEPTAM